MTYIQYKRNESFLELTILFFTDDVIFQYLGTFTRMHDSSKGNENKFDLLFFGVYLKHSLKALQGMRRKKIVLSRLDCIIFTRKCDNKK